MRVVIATTADSVVAQQLEAVAAALAPTGARVTVRAEGPPDLGVAFVATPDVLIRAATAGRRVADALRDGDVVVLPDEPWAGVVACHVAAATWTQKPTLITVAGGSSALRWWATSGSLPRDEEAGARVDWELTAYRDADAIVATSANAALLLETHLGVTVEVVAPELGSGRPPDQPVAAVVLGDPPTRPAFPDLARWLAAAGVRKVALGDAPAEDGVFSGATAEVAAPWGPVELVRDRRRERLDAVVAADPLSPPSSRTVHLVARGVPLIARRGSPTAAAYPGAAAFDDAASLAAAIGGAPTELAQPQPTVQRELPVSVPSHERARAVSVIVPVHRDVRWLTECLDSIRGQTLAPAEILIVDDGSGDEAVTAMLEGQRERHGDLVTILRQPNGGVSRARNLALERAKGDAILMVDSDDVLAPTFIERTVTYLRNRPDVVAVATWTEFFGAYEGVEAKPPFDARVGRRENPIVSTCVLLDRAVIDAGVRFVPELADVYCEDWEVWAHIVALGGRFGLVPEPLVRHRVHPSSGGHRRTPLALDLGRERATSWLHAAPAAGPLSR